MAFGSRYKPRHMSRRTNPVVALAALLLGAFTNSVAGVTATSHPTAARRIGFGRFG